MGVRRFGYTYRDERVGPIHVSIEAVDRAGMALIEGGEPQAFTKYLEESENTICGRHPIGVLLRVSGAVNRSRTQMVVKTAIMTTKCSHSFRPWMLLTRGYSLSAPMSPYLTQDLFVCCTDSSLPSPT